MSAPYNELHRLVDQLPAQQTGLARRLLEALLEESRGAGDPLLRALEAAPVDDDPMPPEEEAAVEEARQQVARGEVVSWDDLKKQFQGGDQ